MVAADDSEGGSIPDRFRDAVIVDMAWATNPALPAPIPGGQSLLERTVDSGITAACVTVADYHYSFRQALEEVNRIYLLQRTHPDKVLVVNGPGDFKRAKAEQRLGIVIHFQTATPLEDDWPNTLQTLHRLGLRVMQLTYNEKNLLGSGCAEPRDGGLTAYGAQVVRAMEALGVIVDLSHVGAVTAMDALRAARRPLVFSHSNASAIVPHARNISDETLRALRDNGGVVGVVAFGPFVHGRTGTGATLDNYLDHIEHMVQVAGPDHVGIGTDIGENARLLPTPDAYDVQYGNGLGREGDHSRQSTEIAGFEQLDKIGNVIQGMVRRGFADEVIRQIIGGNFLRVAGEVWA